MPVPVICVVTRMMHKAELNRVAQDKGDSSYMTVRSAVNTQTTLLLAKAR